MPGDPRIPWNLSNVTQVTPKAGHTINRGLILNGETMKNALIRLWDVIAVVMSLVSLYIIYCAF